MVGMLGWLWVAEKVQQGRAQVAEAVRDCEFLCLTVVPGSRKEKSSILNGKDGECVLQWRSWIGDDAEQCEISLCMVVNPR